MASTPEDCPALDAHAQKWVDFLGVFLQNLVPDTPTQLSLFSTPEQQARREAASMLADSINRRMGRGTITFAATGTTQPWRAKSANVSNRFTTRLTELPEVR